MAPATETAEAPEAPAYIEYPMMLYHPDHAPAVWDKTNVLTRLEPEQYPPMVANSADDEKRLKEAGYQRNGEADGKSFEKAFEVLKGVPEIYEPQPFPMWLEQKQRVVADAAEYERVMGEPFPEVETAAETAPADLLATVTATDKAAAKSGQRVEAR